MNRVVMALVVILGVTATAVGAGAQDQSSSQPIGASSGQGLYPAERGFGFGVIVGEPTGLAAKKWLGATTALDFAVAWSFSGEDAVNLHADYLFHRFGLIKLKSGKMPLYYGLGARVKFGDHDTVFGVRIPIGVDYMFRQDPVGLFLEVVPILDLNPSTEFQFQAALGVRFFFK